MLFDVGVYILIGDYQVFLDIKFDSMEFNFSLLFSLHNLIVSQCLNWILDVLEGFVSLKLSTQYGQIWFGFTNDILLWLQFVSDLSDIQLVLDVFQNGFEGIKSVLWSVDYCQACYWLLQRFLLVITKCSTCDDDFHCVFKNFLNCVID